MDPIIDGKVFLFLEDSVVDDLALNPSLPSNTLQFRYDNTNPQITIEKGIYTTSTSPYSLNITASEPVYGLTALDVNIAHPGAHRYWRLQAAADMGSNWKIKSPIRMFNNSVARTFDANVDLVASHVHGSAFASSHTTDLPVNAFLGVGSGEWVEYPTESVGTVSTQFLNQTLGSDVPGIALHPDGTKFYITEYGDCKVGRSVCSLLIFAGFCRYTLCCRIVS